MAFKYKNSTYPLIEISDNSQSLNQYLYDSFYIVERYVEKFI